MAAEFAGKRALADFYPIIEGRKTEDKGLLENDARCRPVFLEMRHRNRRERDVFSEGDPTSISPAQRRGATAGRRLMNVNAISETR